MMPLLAKKRIMEPRIHRIKAQYIRTTKYHVYEVGVPWNNVVYTHDSHTAELSYNFSSGETRLIVGDREYFTGLYIDMVRKSVVEAFED